MKVQCIKCHNQGTLIYKKSTTKGLAYKYFYVKHSVPKIKWCYLGKYDKLPITYKERLQETNQRQTTQTGDKQKSPKNNFKLPSIQDNNTKSVCGCDLDWSRIEAFQASNPGSNPGSRTNDFYVRG